MLYFDVFAQNDGHNTFVLFYITAILVAYFFFKNIAYVFITAICYTTIVFLMLSEEYLYGAIPGCIIGFAIGFSVVYIAKLCAKPPSALVYRYLVQLLCISLIFFMIDIHQVIPETGFKVGLMILYLAFVILWFSFYFINRQTITTIIEAKHHIHEYDDGYLCVFIIISAYILTPFCAPNIPQELIASTVTLFAVAILWYFFSHLHKYPKSQKL